jgi:Pectate lyase superfamily protein
MPDVEPSHHAPTNRRSVLAALGLASGAWVLGPDAHAQPPSTVAPTPKGVHPVTAFGAVGDGKTDDTAAIQKALNAAGLTGGVALLPAGNFLVKGHLVVHANVALEGVFRAPTARSQGFGTTILAVGGRGNANGEPLFFLKPNAAIKGLTVFYPEQDAKNPTAYPWCVRGQGDNIAVLDVLLVNPWNGVDFGTHPCGRHFVSGLHGQPLNVGLFVDQCLDCGRVENVHFWPFWTGEPLAATRKSGTAFRFARTDWQMISNVFCLGYHTGFHFTALRMDAGNAMVTNSGSDLCDVAVRVEYSQVHAGVLFTNCQINAPVKFSNCGLFGTGTSDHPPLADADVKATHVLNQGQGRATFVGCHFYQPEGAFVPRGYVDAGYPVVYSDGNGLTLTGCDMTGFNRNHVQLGKAARSTLVTSSRFLGGLMLANAGTGKVVTGDNIDE